MASPICNTAFIAICPHAGTVQVAGGSPRVKAAGNPVVTTSDVYTIPACPSVPPAPPPCKSVTWVVGSLRVKVGGQPVLLQSSVGLTQPNALPVTIIQTQVRVRGV